MDILQRSRATERVYARDGRNGVRVFGREGIFIQPGNPKSILIYSGPARNILQYSHATAKDFQGILICIAGKVALAWTAAESYDIPSVRMPR